MGIVNLSRQNVNMKELRLGGVAVSASPAELNILDGVTATTAELNKVAGLPAGARLVVAEERTFTEAGAAGVYTGSVTVPAGATILDIKVTNVVAWLAGTSALMDVGDADDPDGWFTQIDLKATDAVVGEEISFVQTGGKEGAYLSLTTGLRSAAYSASARVVSGIVTTVGTTATAGRTRMLVVMVLPTSSAATKVAS